MIQSISTIIGLVLGAIVAVYYAFCKIQDLWFNHQIDTDEDKEKVLNTKINAVTQQLHTDEVSSDKAVKDYEDSISNTPNSNNGSGSKS